MGAAILVAPYLTLLTSYRFRCCRPTRPLSIPLNLGSANCERRTQPPRPEGRRLSDTLRYERPATPGVPRGATPRRHLRGTCRAWCHPAAVSMSRRLPREVRRELGLAFAAGSGGCWLVGAPRRRGPGLAARGGGLWLAFAPDSRGRPASVPGSGDSERAACPGSAAANEGDTRLAALHSPGATRGHTPCTADSGRPSGSDPG
jgi:hypothetical protein